MKHCKQVISGHRRQGEDVMEICSGDQKLASSADFGGNFSFDIVTATQNEDPSNIF